MCGYHLHTTPWVNIHKEVGAMIGRCNDRRARLLSGGGTGGLHLYDVNIALGNLVDLVRQQEAAYSP